jgi:hypothetical protein
MNLDFFEKENLFEATKSFFNELNITIKTYTKEAQSIENVLGKNYEIVDSVYVNYIDDNSFDNLDQILESSKYKGVLLFSLGLKSIPKRKEIADLTRAFNQKSKGMPVCLLLRYNSKISLALSERMDYKQEWREGEKIGKVIILRDIDTEKPHTGHLRILEGLAEIKSKNFSELHKEWLNVLNIKTLNRSFYERLVAKMDKEGNIIKEGWYFKCLEDIQINLENAKRILNKKIDDELKPQAVIRVIIRLMFMWFMKEKKLIKADFFTRNFADDFLKDKNTYYNAILQNMFFAVLNTKISERRFREQNKNNKYNTEENEYGMFQFFRYEAFFKQGKASEFKQLTDEIPFINGGLFTCHDQKIKQNQSENYIIDGFSDNPKDRATISDNVIFELIDLFNSFVFTVEESTPIEQDIALDPELLGTVFENLIGFYNPETNKNAKKQSGSFYTPREIVDYMCSESLKESLKTECPDLHLQIDKLIDSNEDYLNFPEKTKIIAIITNLKILDPACGSGAFPMGMFNLMVRTVEKLQKHKTTYDNKLDIISKCIYGVDIQNIAIEISKLRFFISLLVDYQKPERIEDFDVLPNLETKFIVANVLIGIKLQGGNLFNQELLAKCKELTAIFAPFTQAKTPNEKKKIKDNFETKKQELVTLLKNNNMSNDEINKISIWNPFNVCYCSQFFDSQIMFGIDKFDIVIGNPPYVQEKKGLFDKNQFPYSEGKDKGKQNLYKVFVENSYNLTKENGYATMIVQSSLMCDISSQYTRELLLQKTEIKEFVEFPKKAKNNEGQVFENVLQGTCIYIFKHKIPDDNRIFKVSIDNDITTINNFKYESLRSNEIIQFYPNGYFIPLIRKGEFEIMKKIQECSISLKQIITGISQGDLNLTNAKSHFSNTPTPVKLLRGEHIHKFYIDYVADEFILNNYKDEKVTLNQKTKFFVCQNITGTVDKYRLHFALTNPKEKFLFGHTVNKFCVVPEMQEELLLGLLNSNLLDWYFRKTSTNNHVNGYEIEQLPIPNATIELQRPIISLVNQILYLKNKENVPILNSVSNDNIALYFEKILDACVYELYFEEEIKSQQVDVLEPIQKLLDKISSLPIEQQILRLFEEWNDYENEVRNRIILQKTRSESVAQIIKSIG